MNHPLAIETLTKHRAEIGSSTFMGELVEDMTRDELIGLVAYLMKQQWDDAIRIQERTARAANRDFTR